MKLTFFELKKLRADQLLTVLLLLACCAVLLFACMHAEPIAYDKGQTARILASFEESPAQTYRLWQEKQQAYRAFLESDTEDALPPDLSDYDAYRRAWEMYSRQTRYHDRLETVLRQTQGEDAVSGYMSSLYRQNQTLKLSHADMQRLPDLFDALAFASALALLLSVLLGVSLIAADRRRGMEQLLFVAPRGRMRTRASKLCALFFSAAAESTLLFLAAILPFLLQGGSVAWDAYLQNHEMFFVCPYPLTVRQAVLLLFLLTWLGSFAFAVTACLIAKHTRHQSVALLLASLPPAVLGTSVFFLPPDGGSPFRLISPFAFCDGNVAFGHLYGIGFGTFAVGGLPVIASAWAFLCAVLCAYFAFRHVPAVDTAHQSKLPFALPTLHVPRFVRTVNRFESAKQLLCNQAICLLLPLLLLFAWQVLPTVTPDQSYTEQTYRVYMQKLQGAYTPQKQQILDGALAEVQRVLGQRQEMEASFASGRITASEMASYMRRFGNAQASEQALVRVAERLDFVRAHPDTEIVYDSGWNILFSFRTHLFPVLSVCAVCCGLFADEYKRGTQFLFPKRARKQIARAKYRFAVVFTCIASLCFEAVQLAAGINRFCFALPFAPSASVPSAQAFGSVPLACAVCLDVSLRVLVYLSAALVCTACSRMLRQKHAAFVCGILSALPWVMG